MVATVVLLLREERGTADRPAAEVSPEREEECAEHVEGRHHGGTEAHEVEHRAEDVRRNPHLHVLLREGLGERVHRRVDERSIEDLVLREEAARQRATRDGQRRREEAPVRDGHVLAETAHVPHVLRAVVVVDARVHRVDDAACAEEEAGLEERVREDVEEARREGADAHAQEHEAELADGAVGEHLLDVVLDERDGRREECGGRADAGDDHHHERRHDEDERQAADQVDARRDHRRRVDERAHRGGAGHRVGEPHVERDLRALARAPEEKREADGRRRGDGDGRRRGDRLQDPDVVRLHVARLQERERRVVYAATHGPEVHELRVDVCVPERRGPGGDARPVEGARVPDEQEHAADEAEVPDAVGDERLLAGCGVRHLVVPEADEEIAAEPDALPPDEEDRQVVREDEDQHREDEEIEVGEEAREARVLGHVLGGVEVDEEAHARHDQHHHARERVHAEARVDGDVPTRVTARRVHPVPGGPGELHVLVLLRVDVLDERDEGHQGCEEAAADGDEGHQADGGVAEALAPDAVHERPDEREREDDRDEREARGGEDAQDQGAQGIVFRKVEEVLEEEGARISSSRGRRRRCGRCA
jgi:hypothetical protein